MTIVWRLNALIASLVAALLVAFAATMVLQAAPRIRTENDSIMRLAREFFLKSLDALAHAPEPAADLEALVAKLQGVRHIAISLVRPEAPDGAAAATVTPPGDTRANPRVSSALDPDTVRLPVLIRGKNLGMIVIAPRPSDEIEEIWEAAFGVAKSGAVLLLGAVLFIGWATRRSLQPINELQIALQRIEAGDYNVGVEADGPAEIRGIANHVNTMAAALRRARGENQRLSGRLVSAQDEERREIARELHDEQGPYLFSVRASGTALKSEVAKPEPDTKKIGHLAAGMLEHIEALQTTNRRVLRRLAPIGLNELGLIASIEGLIAFWHKQRPDVSITLEATPEADLINETTTLTIYRFVQEGLTNALKHAHPARIGVSVSLIGRGQTEREGRDVSVKITDDGRGFTDDDRPGFGMTSMRERVAALGGRLTIETPAEGGTCIGIVLSVDQQQRDDAV